jgi:DNA-binding protein YbaB
MMNFGEMKEALVLQKKMKKIQKSLKKLSLRRRDPGEGVEVEVNGEGHVKQIRILDPGLLDPGRKKDLERARVWTLQRAQEDARTESEKRMKELLGDLPLPF